MRESGVLLPIASLPSPYGIGCFSKEAYKWIDFLKAGHQRYWQILPIGPTGYGDSPYQSFSTYAGNPYFIDLAQLIEEGLLTAEDCRKWHFEENKSYIDYEKVYFSRDELLRKAFSVFKAKNTQELEAFKKKENHWLKEYALYMAIKRHFRGASWQEWEAGIKERKPEALAYYEGLLKEDIAFYSYVQYVFMKQWESLKDYAHKQGVQIIGDIPIYVASDSVDAWANSHLFYFDEAKKPVRVAGCPPDAFAPTGQLWGNPLYNWDVHKKTGFEWWLRRIKHCMKLYDVVRIDHFRGFDEYYAIPATDHTAEHGQWWKGPGIELFEHMKAELGEVKVIAEDLGYLNDSVRALLARSGYPGMKILQFAFDAREESDYLPHNYTSNCVVYTGTHDNDTLLGWYRKLPVEDRALANAYAHITSETDCCEKLIALGYASVAQLVVIPIQDWLGLGSEARINTPSTLGENWKWRVQLEDLTQELSGKMFKMGYVYKRNR